jgi:serine protease Do
MGTGVLIDGRGYILTNHHVVDKVQGIEVHLLDGTNLPARVIQSDKDMDLAVLKVDAGRELPAITIGTSSDLMLGETVLTRFIATSSRPMPVSTRATRVVR